MIKVLQINMNEKGFMFCEGKFEGILSHGRHFVFKPFKEYRFVFSNERNPWITDADLDVIVKSGLLGDDAVVIDLKDNERALVWIDGRFDRILKPGLYALWNRVKKIEFEIIDAAGVRFEHDKLNAIMNTKDSEQFLNEFVVENGFSGLYFKNGEFVDELKPGRYVFWKDMAKVRLYNKDLKSQSIEISGQDILTYDKVTLRLNALVNWNITDAYKAVTSVEDIGQAVYKEAQIVLRSVIGTKDLETVLSEKNAMTKELEDGLNAKTKNYGVVVGSFGIKDVILPGEMREILNKVIEAKKIAEANLVTRREEIAAMRSQLNTAKMLEDNPVLMRLKELEVLEKISAKTNMNVMLGNEKLTDRIMKLI
jgi:regulator of protease activity HflC (stomatin/prohibitin superfamily)